MPGLRGENEELHTQCFKYESDETNLRGENGVGKRLQRVEKIKNKWWAY